MSGGKQMAAVLGTGVLLVALLAWFLTRGYGEVCPQTYEFSKALYSACQTKDPLRLSKVEELLNGDQGSQLPPHERRWLEGILERAQAGDWDSATRDSRRMMEDQVQY